MKFGKRLTRVVNLSNPEWAPFWVNYKLLKKRIKEIGSLGTSSSGPAEPPELSAVSLPGAAAAVEPTTDGDAQTAATATQLQNSAGEVAFFKALYAELKKASDFLTSMENQLMVRRDRLKEGLRQIQDPSQQGYVSVDFFAPKLLKACVEVYKSLIMLENYAIMNHSAFSKILKKHDKITSFNTREQFMSKVVSEQPITNYPRLQQVRPEHTHTSHLPPEPSGASWGPGDLSRHLHSLPQSITDADGGGRALPDDTEVAAGGAGDGQCRNDPHGHGENDPGHAKIERGGALSTD